MAQLTKSYRKILVYIYNKLVNADIAYHGIQHGIYMGTVFDAKEPGT